MSPDQLPSLYDRVERLEAAILRIQSKPVTDRRAARLERKQQRLELTQNRIETILRDADLEAQFEQEAEDAVLPRDGFVINYRPGVDLFEVEVTDSPFDRDYTGGDPLLFRFVGTQATANGTRTKSNTATLANGDYWEGNPTQTLSVGGSSFGDLETFDSVTAYVVKDTGDGAPLELATANILAIDTGLLA